MAERDRPQQGAGQRGPVSHGADLIVIGAGVAGLWLGWRAAERGMDVVILERERVGAGASGGVLGALMPHMPERFDDRKRFQFEALVKLEADIAELEAATGLACGYRRCGRLLPLTKPAQHALTEQRSEGARAHWRAGGRSFRFEASPDPAASGWPAAAAMPEGAAFEDLTARIDPRRLLQALAAAFRRAGGRLIEGVAVAEVDGDARSAHVRLADGETLATRRVAVAAGPASFPLLGHILGRPAASLGRPVKGQAALLDTGVPEDLPLVYHDGIYLVPHEGGRVAVGSTSEDIFEDPHSTDAGLDAVLARARAFCPLIGDALVIERWAGLRPRAAGGDPMVGPVPGCEAIWMLTGGYKITFGLAHLLAARCVEAIAADSAPRLPPRFAVEAHLAAALKNEGPAA